MTVDLNAVKARLGEPTEFAFIEVTEPGMPIRAFHGWQIAHQVEDKKFIGDELFPKLAALGLPLRAQIEILLTVAACFVITWEVYAVGGDLDPDPKVNPGLKQGVFAQQRDFVYETEQLKAAVSWTYMNCGDWDHGKNQMMIYQALVHEAWQQVGRLLPELAEQLAAESA